MSFSIFLMIFGLINIIFVKQLYNENDIIENLKNIPIEKVFLLNAILISGIIFFFFGLVLPA